MTDGRQYSEQEVAAILSRAAELSIEQAGARGTSLSELERIAMEAGIDPQLVRRAASEVSSGRTPVRPSVWRRLFGPLRLRFETVVPGEITEGDHEVLFDVVQSSLNLPGTLNRAGRSFSWSLTNQQRSLTVHVTSRNGQTTVRVEETLGSLAGGIWGGVFGGVGGGLGPVAGILAGSAFGPLGAILGVLGTPGLAAGGTRALYGAAVNAREAKLSQVFESLVEAVREQAAHDGASSASESALVDARARAGLLDAPRVEGSSSSEEPVRERAEREVVDAATANGSASRRAPS